MYSYPFDSLRSHQLLHPRHRSTIHLPRIQKIIRQRKQHHPTKDNNTPVHRLGIHPSRQWEEAEDVHDQEEQDRERLDGGGPAAQAPARGRQRLAPPPLQAETAGRDDVGGEEGGDAEGHDGVEGDRGADVDEGEEADNDEAGAEGVQGDGVSGVDLFDK